MTQTLPEPTVLTDAEGRPAFAVLAWSDWRALAERLGADAAETDEAAEDAFAARAFAEARAADDGFRLPLEQLRHIREGGHPVAVLRKWRGWDQAELARRMGTTANYIAQIESRARRGVRQVAAFAQALDAPEEVIRAHL